MKVSVDSDKEATVLSVVKTLSLYSIGTSLISIIYSIGFPVM